MEALYEADNSEKVFINSAEVFTTRTVRRIVNSRGVDVSYETYLVSGEYVVQCVEPQDVETYHHFSYPDAKLDALRQDVAEALAMTQSRAEAERAPRAGKYTILLSGKNLQEIMQYYCGRSSAGVVYQKYSNYQIGDHVQGDAIQGDALTIYMKAKEPYSDEGIMMHLGSRRQQDDGRAESVPVSAHRELFGFSDGYHDRAFWRGDPPGVPV